MLPGGEWVCRVVYSGVGRSGIRRGGAVLGRLGRDGLQEVGSGLGKGKGVELTLINDLLLGC